MSPGDGNCVSDQADGKLAKADAFLIVLESEVWTARISKRSINREIGTSRWRMLLKLNAGYLMRRQL